MPSLIIMDAISALSRDNVVIGSTWERSPMASAVPSTIRVTPSIYKPTPSIKDLGIKGDKRSMDYLKEIIDTRTTKRCENIRNI